MNYAYAVWREVVVRWQVAETLFVFIPTKIKAEGVIVIDDYFYIGTNNRSMR
jgi:hypothetical protein